MCRYFPPDFDPADLPKGQRGKDNSMKVRMMLPMTVRCTTCGEFMYKGTKFNCKKEDVVGQDYLGLQIFRFYMRCRKCSAEITYITDPQNLDYKVEHGATRNFEQWKQEQSIEEALFQRLLNTLLLLPLLEVACSAVLYFVVEVLGVGDVCDFG